MVGPKTAIREVAEGVEDDRRLGEALAALQAEHDPRRDGYDPAFYRRALELLDDADASSCSDEVHERVQACVRTMEDVRDEAVLTRAAVEPISPEERAYSAKLAEVIKLMSVRRLHPRAVRARVLLGVAGDQALEGRHTDGLSTLVDIEALLNEAAPVAPMADFADNRSEIEDHLYEINRKAKNLKKRAEQIGLSESSGMARQFQMAMTLKSKGGQAHPRQADLQAAYEQRIGDARRAMEGEDIYKTYNTTELAALMRVAHHLGIDDRTLSDMLYIGSRKKKFRDVDAMIAQLLNWRDFPVRKYPFKFSSDQEYKEFVAFVRAQLAGTPFAAAEIRIMGSSLRSRLAGDIDFSVVVDQNGFDQHMQRLREQAGLQPQDEDPGFMKVARRAGFMKLSLGDFLRSVQARYPDLKVQAIGLTLLGGPFDLAPAITI